MPDEFNWPMPSNGEEAEEYEKAYSEQDVYDEFIQAANEMLDKEVKKHTQETFELLSPEAKAEFEKRRIEREALYA